MNEQYRRQLRREVLDRHANLMKDTWSVSTRREAMWAACIVLGLGALLLVSVELETAIIVFAVLVGATAVTLSGFARMTTYANKLLPNGSKPAHIKHQEQMLQDAFAQYLDAFFVSLRQSLLAEDFQLDLANLMATRSTQDGEWDIDVRRESFHFRGAQYGQFAPGTVG